MRPGPNPLLPRLIRQPAVSTAPQPVERPFIEGSQSAASMMSIPG
jgi:hypothetical protein